MLESRVREVEAENRQIRLRLSQSLGTAAQPQEGNYGNQQWGASADTGPEDVENTAEEKNNHTECPRAPSVQKCEVGNHRTHTWAPNPHMEPHQTPHTHRPTPHTAHTKGTLTRTWDHNNERTNY